MNDEQWKTTYDSDWMALFIFPLGYWLMFFVELLFIIGVIQIFQYSSLDGVAIGKVKVITYLQSFFQCA